MTTPIEIKLKFLVPAAARAGVAAEMARAAASMERSSLSAMYLDTDDRLLARAGISWRQRREGRRWIQTLKAAGPDAAEQHEVIRPDASHDAAAHAGTPVGEQLEAILKRARASDAVVGVRFRTEVRRLVRRVRTRGAVVEVTFDEGRIVSAAASQRIREIEFELASGSAAAMLALVERWRARFGLIYDPRGKTERGDRLASGSRFPQLRKASGPGYSRDATVREAFGAVLGECMAQITRNAVGLIEGDPAQRVEHVHQLRVGIRRLRSALRSFEGWAPSPPDHLVQDLRSLFDKLGRSRDSDVLDSGVAVALAQAGSPPLPVQAGADAPDPVEAVRAADAQRSFLAWLAWCMALAHDEDGRVDAGEAVPPLAEAEPTRDAVAADAVQVDGAAPTLTTDPAEAQPVQHAVDRAAVFGIAAERRLRRWHRRIVADWKAFDGLDEDSLHALRKRIKRQRYAVEFFAPVLRRRQVERYHGALAAIQDRMGTLNDLLVARARYQPLVASDPAAWFALVWLAARIVEVRALAKPGLARLTKAKPPTH